MKKYAALLLAGLLCVAGAAQAQTTDPRLKVFQADIYLLLHPNLRETVGTDQSALENHWLTVGIKECRESSRFFNVRDYLDNYPEINAKVGGDCEKAVRHFVEIDQMSNRLLIPIKELRWSIIANITPYREANPDLSALSDAQLREHWLTTGVHECRPMGTDIAVKDYHKTYPDQAAKTCEQALNHYWLYGQYEFRHVGTIPTNPRLRVLDPAYYVAQYPDLAGIAGNAAAINEHWVTVGARECRRGSAAFSAKDYMIRYPNVAADCGLAVDHWVRYGIRAGMNGKADADPRLTVLDPVFYLTRYPDLRDSFGTDVVKAQNHWVNYGIKECRQGSPNFSIIDYLLRNPDVSASMGMNCTLALEHWLNHGGKEGRNAAPNPRLEALDPSFYLAAYPDLRGSFGSSELEAQRHWINYGVRECRQGSASFSAKAYLDRYPDVRQETGGDCAKAVDHWVTFGRLDGRNGAPVDVAGRVQWGSGLDVFNASFYISRYPDLRYGKGNDFAQLARHWLTNGIRECRQASPDFDVMAYLARYEDLRKSFGTDCRAAVDHWLNHGRHEGRDGAPPHILR